MKKTNNNINEDGIGSNSKDDGTKTGAKEKIDVSKQQNTKTKKRVECPCCEKDYVNRSVMFLHFRLKHQDQLDANGGNTDLEIPQKKAQKICLPSSFKPLVNKKTWDMLKKGRGGYRFLTQMVKNNAQNDLQAPKLKRWPEHVDYLRRLKASNVLRHARVQEILKILIDRGFFNDDDGPIFDDTGGILPDGGFLFQSHGGLFNLSLDRINQKLPHFIEDKPADYNLRFTAAAMNNRSGLVDKFGDKSCEELRKEAAKEITDEDIASLLKGELEKTIYSNGKVTQLYQCCHNTFHKDPLCRAEFGDFKTLYKEMKLLLKDQNAKSPISGFLLRSGLSSETYYKMSLDAIDPRKGHVRGNLQWVCMCMNNSNQDKHKKSDDADSKKDYPPSKWTPLLFMRWIGLGS